MLALLLSAALAIPMWAPEYVGVYYGPTRLVRPAISAALHCNMTGVALGRERVLDAPLDVLVVYRSNLGTPAMTCWKAEMTKRGLPLPRD